MPSISTSTNAELVLSGFFCVPWQAWVDCSKNSQFENIESVIRKFYPQGKYCLIENKAEEYICVAGLHTIQDVMSDENATHLILVWFERELANNIAAIIQAKVRLVNWEQMSEPIGR